MPISLLSTIAPNLVSGGFGLLSGLSNMVGAQQQFNQQKKLIEQQYQNQIDFWKMNNEYNTPSSQMQRLRDAGINPFTQYSGNNSSSYGNVMQQPPQSPNYVGMAMQTALQVMQTMAQIRNINADTERKEVQNQVDNSTIELNHIIGRLRDAEYRYQDQEIYIRQQLSSKEMRALDYKMALDYERAQVEYSNYRLNMYDLENKRPLEVKLLQGQGEQLDLLCQKLKKEFDLTDEQINLFRAQTALILAQRDHTYTLNRLNQQQFVINSPQATLARAYNWALQDYNGNFDNSPTFAESIGTNQALTLFNKSKHDYTFSRTGYFKQLFGGLKQLLGNAKSAEERGKLLQQFGPAQAASGIFSSFMSGIGEIF